MTPKRLNAAMAAIELKRITDDNEPFRRILAMARAIETYAEMLQSDDPGDDDRRTMPMIESLMMRANDIVDLIPRITRRK